MDFGRREQEKRDKKKLSFFFFLSFLLFDSIHSHQREQRKEWEWCLFVGWLKRVYVHGTTSREKQIEIWWLWAWATGCVTDEADKEKKKKTIANHNGRTVYLSFLFCVLRPPSCVFLVLGLLGKVGGKNTPLEDERQWIKMTKRKKGTAKPNQKRLRPKNRLSWKDELAEAQTPFFFLFLHSFVHCLLALCIMKG